MGVKAEVNPANLAEWKALLASRQTSWSVKAERNPANLAETGWGVIFGHDADPAIKEALSPLLEHRQQQAAQQREHYYREYSGADGYHAGESAAEFRGPHSAPPGAVDPDQMPYYLLLVGDPQSIPFTFQYELDVQHAVGRIHFDALDEYANYARSAVKAEAEAGRLARPRRVTFFAPQHPDDQATRLSATYLVKPLAERIIQERPAWAVETVLADEATKARLSQLLGGDETPALLFTAGHEKAFPADDPQQLSHQGALVCQDWPGPVHWPKAVPQDFYMAADDVGDNAQLLGLVAFFFGGNTAGTPQVEDFPYMTSGEPKVLAPHAFVARLPQWLLGHPKGGALAVVGHVERAWGYSFTPPYGSLAVFENLVKRLLDGNPVGYAMEPFSERYAELAVRLSAELEEIRFGKATDERELANMQIAVTDARNYVILGDPAVHLAVGEAPAERRPIPVVVGAEQPVDVGLGLSRVGELLEERAPVLRQTFDEQAATLRATLDQDPATLGEAALAEREQALAALGELCEKALEISFDDLARGEDPPAYDSRCPFRGLEPFKAEHRSFFFGRGELVARMQQMLAGGNLLAVVGPSGCGKSSLVLAGLLPALQDQDSELRLVYRKPESDPRTRPVTALSQVDDGPAVLVVDQLEELCNAATSEATQDFVERLLAAREQLKVVITMRSDAWELLKPYEQLAEAMERGVVEVGPMERSELRQAMERQAEAVGLQFEEGLSDAILDDVCQGPGAMVLLQHVLEALWERRHGRWLKSEEYQAMGGARQAVLAMADSFYRQLPSSEERNRARAILLRLVPPVEDIEPDQREPERRRGGWAERLVSVAEMAGYLVRELSPEEQARVRDIFVRLVPADEEAAREEGRGYAMPQVWLEELVPVQSDPAPVKASVKRLADARLIVTSRSEDDDRATVAMAHASLHQAWPVLQHWLEEEEKANNLKLRQRIGAAARAWELRGRDTSLLVHRGASLQLAQELSEHPILALNRFEQDYRDACVEEEEQERAEVEKIERDWQSLQAAAQESEEAKAALATLAESFEDVATRHQQLRDLLELSQRLRDLRSDFDRCVEVVERAGMNVAALAVPELKSNWEHVQKKRVNLQVFVERYPGADIGVWFAPLQEAASGIEGDLADTALGSLVKRAKAFERKLAEAESRVLEQLKGTIDDLVRLSDRTLGRLAER